MNKSLTSDFNYFLDNQFREFNEGEWLAIYNNAVISHNITLSKVIEDAKKIAPLSNVLFSKVKRTASYLSAR